MSEKKTVTKKKAAPKNNELQCGIDAMLLDADIATMARCIMYGITDDAAARLRAIIEQRGHG